MNHPWWLLSSFQTLGLYHLLEIIDTSIKLESEAAHSEHNQYKISAAWEIQIVLHFVEGDPKHDLDNIHRHFTVGVDVILRDVLHVV